MRPLASRPRSFRSILGLAVLACLPAAVCPAARGEEPARSVFERLAGERWMGVFVRGEKAGWSRSALGLETHEGLSGWVVSGESRLTFVLMDRRTRIESSERTVYEATPPHRLLRHESTVKTADSSSRLEIRRSGDDFEVRVSRGGASEVRRASFRHCLGDVLAAELAAIEGAPEGSERKAVVFLSDLPAEEDAVVRVVKAADTGQGGREFEIATSSARLRSRSRIAGDGALIEIRLGPGFVLRAMAREEAQAMGAGADLSKLSVTAFLEKPLGGAARRVTRLALEAEGLEGADVPTDGRQSVEALDGGRVRVRIVRQGEPPACREAPDDLRKYLEADAELPCDDREIRSLARDLTSGEELLHRRAARICSWVHANLRKTARSFQSSALEVLKRREGDCTEHALLAAALCRAAGVPAKVVVGLAYAGDEKRVFSFHAWIEIWSSRWSAMDPSWDEPAADATHLKLAEGTDPYALLPFLGDLKLKVLEVAWD